MSSIQSFLIAYVQGFVLSTLFDPFTELNRVFENTFYFRGHYNGQINQLLVLVKLAPLPLLPPRGASKQLLFCAGSTIESSRRQSLEYARSKMIDLGRSTTRGFADDKNTLRLKGPHKIDTTLVPFFLRFFFSSQNGKTFTVKIAYSSYLS